MSRYFIRTKGTNYNISYKKLFKKRGIDKIEQYRTPVFRPVTDKELEGVESYIHIMQLGDAYWKLSTRAYGDPQFWWVIASFNRRPTLSDVPIGTKIKIPE